MRYCSVCNGNKKILGLGGMHKDCYECKGKGIVASEEQNNEEVVVEIRGRGRPKKEIKDEDRSSN